MLKYTVRIVLQSALKGQVQIHRRVSISRREVSAVRETPQHIRLAPIGINQACESVCVRTQSRFHMIYIYISQSEAL